MEIACSVALRPSTSGGSLFTSSFRFLPPKVAFPHSIRLRGQSYHGFIQPCFPSLAVFGNRPAITSDCLEESTPGSTKREMLFQGKSTAQDKEVEGKDKPTDEFKMLEVCDKLIEVLMVDKPNPGDWRKLLAFSRLWTDIAPHFYKRCQERADAHTDPGMKLKFLRLSRKMKDVDDDVKRHNELIEVIKRDPLEIMAIVARRRKDFTVEFFVHVRDVAESYYENLEERDELINMGKACLAAVQSYDGALGSTEDMKAAEAKFTDIISSPTLDIATNKIDDLAKKNQLDSSLLMILTKAWSAAKESTLMKDEVKDILYHLYKTGIDSIQKMIPKDIRLLKYLLSLEDPCERLAVLKDTFIPTPEYETDEVDYLWTTPKALHSAAKTIVDAFSSNRRGSVTREARDMMQPKVIQKLDELKKMIEDNFL
ncbi:endoribonuclease E-like protein [Rhynchospora pubera]|uniref:Endoribonuclease E-like protein n=1 Tax=Rhynchospora pubera TaxID=906938 RepID=A0AAV8FCE3_9POAL|nr:endoribonuclease E-like protein [Rhynchospora pubera]